MALTKEVTARSTQQGAGTSLLQQCSYAAGKWQLISIKAERGDGVAKERSSLRSESLRLRLRASPHKTPDQSTLQATPGRQTEIHNVKSVLLFNCYLTPISG